jgi:hypothetical protein
MNTRLAMVSYRDFLNRPVWSYFLLALVLSSSLLGMTVGSSRAQGAGANGCVGDLAYHADFICPTSPDVATYIAYVRSFAGGVSIALTPAGINYGLSCEGSASLVMMASGLYAELPYREYDGLLWADPYITSEMMAHSIFSATNITELVSHGNPVDVVFADFSTPGSQGLMWRSFDDPTKPFAPGVCAGNNPV